jgi:hypothetical protein
MNKVSEQVLNKFHTCFVDFIEELIEQFPEELKLQVLRVLVKDSTPPWKLMEKYNAYILPHKRSIDSRDDTFFLSDTFSQLADQKILSLKELWLKIDDDDKEIIWRWFDVLNTIAMKFNSL